MIVHAYEHLSRRHAIWILAVHAGLIVWLASSLPPHVWFVGDPGVKLLAARDAAAHPLRPLESPARAGDSTFPQPFFVQHDDHAHAMTTPLFPVLTAPWLAAFGLRGAYVLPALGWLAIAPLTVAVSRRLQTRASPAALWITSIIATPFVFYGLEFWEHAPAVAAALGAAVLAFGTPSNTGVRPAAPMRLIGAGALGGVAILLRPEALWTMLAIALVSLIIAGRAREVRHPAGLVLIGTGLILAPLLIYNLTHFGAIAQPHLSGNLEGLSQSWWASRAEFAWRWLGIHRPWTQLAMLLIAVTIVWSRMAGRRVATMAPALVGVVVLAAELGRGHDLRETLWRAFPIALLTLLPAGPATPARRALWWLIGVPLVAAVLFAPNDGGGQWGPRYLLPIVPFALILALDTTTTLAPVIGRRLAWLAVAAVIGSGTAASWQAYDELRAAKTYYDGLTRAVARAAGERAILTDVWWLPQVMAGILPRERIQWVESAARGTEWIAATRVSTLLVVTEGPPDVPAWTGPGCVAAEGPAPLENGLRATRFTCR